MVRHKAKIPKGKRGKFSKIKEEFLEAKDAHKQRKKVLLLMELSDLILAIEEFATQEFNVKLDDLVQMSNFKRAKK